MLRGQGFQQILAGTLLLIVVAVCISPVADLDACTLRAQNDASVIVWLLTAALFLLVLRMDIDVQSRSIGLATVASDIPGIQPNSDVLTLASAWRI